MKPTRLLLWATIIVAIAGIAVAIHYSNNGAVEKTSSTAPVLATAHVGDTAPQFALATDHGLFDLSKTRMPVFLEVFATWCPHCQRETAVINQLYEEYKARVAFVSVTGSQYGMDRQSPESEQDVLTFVQMFHVVYPVGVDTSMKIANQYLQGGYPTIVVIGRDKRISYITSGETPYAELAAAIRKTLPH